MENIIKNNQQKVMHHITFSLKKPFSDEWF